MTYSEAQAFTIKDFMAERIFNEFLVLIHLKVPVSLRGSLRIWKEHKKLVNKFFNFF